jgi:arylsulfatase A-like enzyme
MTKRPNIVLIMSDQQRPDSLACYGNCFVDTPNVDALAAGGVTFMDAFTPFPLCTPARAALWTGMMPSFHGIMDCVYGIDDAFFASPRPQTVFDAMSAAGYEVAYFGKWHLGGAQPDAMDHWHAFNSGGGHWIDGFQATQDGEYMPYRQTERMLALLRSRPVDSKPLFVVQSYYPPHEPYTAPAAWLERYRNKGIFRPGYYAGVSAVDECVGNITRALSDSGMAHDTMVIYTSDHGEHFNYRAKNNKSTGHDDSIRIPLIISGPKALAAGERVVGAAGLEDLTPTILELAGIPEDLSLHGRSLVRSLNTGEPTGGERYLIQNVEDFRLYAHWDELMAGVYLPDARSQRSPDGEWDRQRALWTPQHKLILSDAGNHALFNLELDPEEELNLFGAPRSDTYNQYQHYPSQHALTVELINALLEECDRVDDTWGMALGRSVLEVLLDA